ncbi:MAG: hypothetical protein IJW08_04245 [Lentisphaeria bacterium]|nr:hypothetical protein [Lentisphaeria bacterium]
MEVKRYEIPGLVNRPSWWKVRTNEIESICRNIKNGSCTAAGKTPWGFPVYQVVYNDYPDSSNEVNWMSVMSTKTPELFGNKEGSPQTVMISGGIHGAEIEGVILVLNLISLLETGVDLRGRKNDKLLELARLYRLVLFPCVNMDGRAVSPDHRIGASIEECRRAGEGFWTNDKVIRWPEMKEYFPLPLERVAHTGGYCNSEGYNIMHDGTPGNIKTAEALAILKAAEKYKVDLYLNLHSQPETPYNGFRMHSMCSFPYSIEVVKELSRRCKKVLEERGFVYEPDAVRKIPCKLDINTPVHLCSGAATATIEFAARDPENFDVIADTGYAFLETILESGKEMLFCDRKNWKTLNAQYNTQL